MFSDLRRHSRSNAKLRNDDASCRAGWFPVRSKRWDGVGGEAAPHASDWCPIIEARGDLTDPARLHDFYARCVVRIGASPPALLLDLTAVTDADSRLVATLVALVSEARTFGIAFEINASLVVKDWIEFCLVDGLIRSSRSLRPTLTPGPS